MRPGSTRAWVDLTLEVAPELARELVAAELELRPGDVDLWELAATIAHQFRDHASAEALYRTVLAMDERASACLALAELLVRRGAPAPEVQELLSTATRLSGGRRPARARALISELRMRGSQPDFKLIASELEAVWGERDQADGTITASDVGFALIATYLQWAGDLERHRAARLENPPAAGVELPPLPTESELAERALATVIDLEARISGQPHLSALLECYRGIAASLQRAPSTP
jgi:hypothetical protein